MNKHCISYPTESLIFCKLLLFFLTIDIYKFICAYIVSFYANITKLEQVPIITDLLSQNPTKNIMLLYKKVVFIDCCKWLSFQSAIIIIVRKL